MTYGTLTFDTAWILGLIAGDGGVHHNHLDITFGPAHDMPMAREAERVLKTSGWPVSSVNIKMVPKDPPRNPCLVLFAYGQALVNMIRRHSSFGLQDWRVPPLVLASTDGFKGAWIGGLVDADGHVEHVPEESKRTVAIDSTNLAGLDQVSAMLTELSVEHRRYSHNRNIEGHAPAHKIVVCNRTALERFAAVVPLRCPRKKAALAEALASYKRDILTRDEVDALLPELTKRLRAKEPYATIAEALGVLPDQVRNIVRTRELEGPGRGHGARHQEIEALIPEVLKRVEAGELLTDVAKSLGLTPTVLKNAFAKRGLKVGRRAGPGTKRAAELTALLPQIRELVEQGLTNREIAETVGHDLNPQRVANLLCKHGIARRKA